MISFPGQNLSHKKDDFGLRPELTKKIFLEINTKHTREYKCVRESGLNQEFPFHSVQL